jgi:prepilin-type processing-associated H-X9-DG protein
VLNIPPAAAQPPATPVHGTPSDYAIPRGWDLSLRTGDANYALSNYVNANADPVMIVSDWKGKGTNQQPSHRITQWKSRTNLANVRDGATNTIMMGEKNVRTVNLNVGTHDGCVFNGATANYYSRRTDRPLVRNPNGKNVNNGDASFGSWHPGVCQFLMADGSVRAVRNDVSSTVLVNLTRRADGTAIPPLD